MYRSIFFFLFLLLVASVVAFWAASDSIFRFLAIYEAQHVALPHPVTASFTFFSSEGTSKVFPALSLPEVNHDVPFTSQAPDAVWDALHEDACEEASVAMVLRYFDGDNFLSPQDADVFLQKLVALNERALQAGPSQNVRQVAQLIKLMNTHLYVSVLSEPTQTMLMQALSNGSLVIAPAAARLLGNPYYRSPGPLYHMLVLRGYTRTGYVITNDPGTKRGEAFPYRWNILMHALHDWNDGDVYAGKSAVIVVGQRKN